MHDNNYAVVSSFAISKPFHSKLKANANTMHQEILAFLIKAKKHMGLSFYKIMTRICLFVTLKLEGY